VPCFACRTPAPDLSAERSFLARSSRHSLGRQQAGGGSAFLRVPAQQVASAVDQMAEIVREAQVVVRSTANRSDGE
jgi:hypothetical protein